MRGREESWTVRSLCVVRYLLSADPQMGKTGVFLHLGYLLWRLVGSPQHNSPVMDEVPRVELEWEEGEEEELEHREIAPEDQEEYPGYDYISRMTLRRPQPSRTYGDPSDEEVLKWYRTGHRTPHRSVNTPTNKTFRRATVSLPPGESTPSSRERESSSRVEYVYSQYAARPLEKSDKVWNYEERNIKEKGLEGRLLLNRETLESKWTLIKGYPTLWNKLEFPPILVPSCGRPSSGLLDLRTAMEGRTNYVQIVIVRAGEEEDYLHHLMSDNNIDVFVMNNSTPTTVGAARWTAKKLAEIITRDGFSRLPFCLVLDDNIISWKAVTLINDPHPPIEDVEPSDERSQRTDISLLRVMEYCSNDNIEKHQLHKFSVIGFSIGSRQNINNIRIAFGRTHLFAAIFLNLKKLGYIEYNKDAWAMEDIDFNKRTDERGGVLVKCRRFLAQKKRLDHGGVVAENVSFVWFKTFSDKRKEWMISLRSTEFSETREQISFRKWSSVLDASEDNPTRELIERIHNVISGSGCLPNFRDRISKLIQLLGSAESSLKGVESEEKKVGIIRKIFGVESQQKNRKRSHSQSNKLTDYYPNCKK